MQEFYNIFCQSWFLVVMVLLDPRPGETFLDTRCTHHFAENPSMSTGIGCSAVYLWMDQVVWNRWFVFLDKVWVSRLTLSVNSFLSDCRFESLIKNQEATVSLTQTEKDIALQESQIVFVARQDPETKLD
jgi:hypothetical protein